MSRILIMSVTAGEGHNSTAKAMKAEFEKLGAECDVLDTFEYVAPELAKIISEGYLLLCDKAKHTYRLVYTMSENRKNLLEDYSPQMLLSMTFMDKLEEYFDAEQYDVIVFTHPFAGMILDVMKARKKVEVYTVGILTDFTFHPYWENCVRNDYVVIPSEGMIFQGRRKGFKDSQLLPLGIPIKPQFSEKIPKTEARRKLGIDIPDETKLVLVMGGSMGYGNIADTVKKIDSCGAKNDFHIYAVCGNNAEAKKKTEAIKGEIKHGMTVVGFVNYISDLMDASDFIVTKPGGLTSSEALAKGLPMVIVNPIPGQEERNTEFLLNNGCAVATSKTYPIEECVFGLLNNERRIKAMEECVAVLGKPNSARDVCNMVIDLAHTPYIVDEKKNENEGFDELWNKIAHEGPVKGTHDFIAEQKKYKAKKKTKGN